MRLILRSSLLLAVLAVSPALAQEGTGGAPAESEPLPPDPGVTVVSSGGFTLAVRPDSLVGWTARFRGDVPDTEAGRTLAIQRYETRRRRWKTVARTQVEHGGTFLARWATNRPGHFRVRAILVSSRAKAATTSPELTVTVYRRSMATWYGPGFYGNRTACGRTMTRTLRGVAHRTLPCGTKIALMYRGRKLTVPVVDRGPYSRGVEWDLTAGTAQALGFRYTDEVAAVRVRAPARRPVP